MAASRADAVACVARAFGGRVLRDGCRDGPASHDGRGVRFVFEAPRGDNARYAIDVEPRDLACPGPLASALGPAGLERWTEIEVLAKLIGLPAHLVLRAVLSGSAWCEPGALGVEVVRKDTAAHWIAVGRRRT
jgi:hypothetical protein